MCIPNNAGTPKTSSMEVDVKIPTKFNRHVQGHRLLSVENLTQEQVLISKIHVELV